MDSNGLQCPENSNSTDCLLRSLLQLLQEYRDADDVEIDWDPINFAFTLVIGVLAITFALATILQAIFAAGKGRRKSNKLAIGQWSDMTVKTWDWSQMNFQSTVFTPILQESSLEYIEAYQRQKKSNDKQAVRQHKDKEYGDSEQSDSEHDDWEPPREAVSNTRFSHILLRPKRSQRPSAAWLQFFDEVGLARVDVQAWGSHTMEAAADYLPDDLTAAPAYAQLGAIVTTAVLAGVQRLDVDQQRYPILVGQEFQIDFHQHSTLGLVGAYSRYDKTKRSRTPTLKEFKSAIRYGRGVVEAKMEMRMDLSTKTERHGFLRRFYLNQKLVVLRKSPSATGIFALSDFHESHLSLIVGLFADTPKYVPALFPNETLRISIPLAAIALNGKYWAEALFNSQRDPTVEDNPNWGGFIWHLGGNESMGKKVMGYYERIIIGSKDQEGKMEDAYLLMEVRDRQMHAFMDQQMQEGVEEMSQALDNLGTARAAIPRGSPEARDAPEAPESTEAPESLEVLEVLEALEALEVLEALEPQEASRPTDGHRIALQMCLRFLQDPDKLEEWFFAEETDRQEGYRGIILAQMKGLDGWLENKKDVESRSVMLCNTTIVFLEAEKMKKEWLLQGQGPLEEAEGDDPDAQDQWQSTDWENTIRGLYFNTLQVLRNLDQDFDRSQDEVKKLESLVDAPPSQLWDKLRAMAHYHTRKTAEWAFWDEIDGEENKRMARDIDDVIIYRCLLGTILFRTAADSTEILKSGLWDKVMPII